VYKDTPSHPDLVDAYYNLATIYERVHQYEKAICYMHRCIEIGEKIYEVTPESFDLSLDYEYLATLYATIGNEEKAQEYREKARRIEEQE
jgi:tetratricopeptide (TPR) repeat protein